MGQVGQTGPAAPKMMLGQDDSCQNGPGYWCASPENAIECNVCLAAGGGGGGGGGGSCFFTV